MFSGFARYIGAPGQARSMARMAAQDNTRFEANEQRHRVFGDDMQVIQDLAFDAERWPHCIELQAKET